MKMPKAISAASGLTFSILALMLTLGFPLPSNAEDSAKPISIEVVGEVASDQDSKDVLAALHKLLTGVEQRNFEQVGACLSPDVVMIEKNNELLYGKQSVVDRAKSNLTGNKVKSPVKKLTIRDPFIHVKGDTASIFFNADKELEDGSKFDSLCNEVYEKKNGQWLVLKFQTNWKPVK